VLQEDTGVESLAIDHGRTTVAYSLAPMATDNAIGIWLAPL
jgi:hypothetical protein